MADEKLIQRLRAGGIKAPEMAIEESTNAGLKLAFACALLEKESAGGNNVFGHDRDKQGQYIFPARDGTVPVTEAVYREYKKRRKATGKMQGVGPCQLTWWEFQDEADREGGCWKPQVNMRVGFRRLAGLMKQHGVADGARRYNGSGDAAVAYSEDLRKKARAWEARLAGAPMPAAPRLLRRGDEGRLVEQLTKRLSYVRRRGTREAYLDGTRTRLDAEAEAAVKAFQRDHGLTADGVVGSRTGLKLNRAVRIEKARREKAAQGGGMAPVPRPPDGSPVPISRPPKAKPARLPALVDQLKRLDAETDRAWTAVASYGGRRRRLLERLQERQSPGVGPAPAEGFGEMTAILLRIESKLSALVVVEQRELAAESSAQPVAAPAPSSAPASGGGGLAPEATVVQVEDPPAPAAEGPPPSGSSNGAGSPPAAPPAPEPARDLDDFTDRELLERIERLDRALGRARTVLVRRYAATELELARLGVKPKPGPKVRPGPKDKPGPGGTKEPPKRDPDRAERSTIVPGDKAWRVRQSKVALARFLKRHRRETTRGLRRKLLTEVRTPKAARLASPAWERAVREAQAIAKLPVTGQLDEPLEKALAKLWPSDAALRRIVRATPAWRTMPGQVSRNFALREFACNDGTQYIDGLVREQGLTKKQAKFRAKQLADRLERLRAREGNRSLRPNSVFRSKAHNARVGGVVGSAHTKGYAADLPAPSGLSLAAHRGHVRAIFEGGVGFYPTQHFVHGDFDPNERGDNWTG